MNHSGNHNHHADSHDASNSADAVCIASKSGRRKSGVDDAVAWITKYPGIDAYTVAWLHAGGQLVVDQGQYHFSGLPFSADFKGNTRFAQVLKMQVRVQEASKRGLIEVTERLIDRKVKAVDTKGVGFVRHIKSTAYKLAGSVDPLLDDQQHQPQTGAVDANKATDDEVEAHGIPDNFDDFMADLMPDLSD